MNEDALPGRTAWETQQYLKDHGHSAEVVQAHRDFADFLEADEDGPVPPGKDIVVAALPSVAAVDRWAAKHHVSAGWNGRVYKATVVFSPALKYVVQHLPAKALDGQAASETREPELAVAAA